LITAGALPQTVLGEITVLPDSLSGFKGPASKGREGRKDGREGKKGKIRGREGRERGLPSVRPVPNLPLHHLL